MPRWFRKKRFGYGWTPATWQGWTVMDIFIAALTALVPFAARLGQVRLLELESLLIVGLLAVIAFTSGKDSDP